MYESIYWSLNLQESLRDAQVNLRKHVQENESLEFRNQQLSKRVALLQEDVNSPAKSRKKKVQIVYFNIHMNYVQPLTCIQGGADSSVNEIHAQELASKISENERLHMKVDIML